MIAMRSTRTARWLYVAVRRLGWPGGRLYNAWAVAFLAYTGLWAYHAARYGVWHLGPEPAWLGIGLAATLWTCVILTVVIWRRRRKSPRT